MNHFDATEANAKVNEPPRFIEADSHDVQNVEGGAYYRYERDGSITILSVHSVGRNYYIA